MDAHVMPQHSKFNQILLWSLTPQPCFTTRAGGRGEPGEDALAMDETTLHISHPGRTRLVRDPALAAWVLLSWMLPSHLHRVS